MRRVLLSPAWLARHAGLIFFLVTFAILGRWQWDVSRSPTGTLQNTLYAFQWWSFALIFIYGWWWMLRHELRDQPAGPAEEVEPPPPPLPEDDEWMAAVRKRHRILPPPADATPAQLAEYRAWLAQLHALDEQRRRTASAAG